MKKISGKVSAKFLETFLDVPPNTPVSLDDRIEVTIPGAALPILFKVVNVKQLMDYNTQSTFLRVDLRSCFN